MSRALNDLSSLCRPKAIEFLARCVEAGIPVMIVDTLRTEAEHAQNLANGTSATAKSKHLPGKLRGIVGIDAEKSDAIDVCPYDQYQLYGPDKLKWASSDPVWARLGAIGEPLGFRWGGRWVQPHDPGHFEVVR